MRTENVFKDMTSLIDTMTKNFEARVEQERQQTTNIFQKLLEEQKAVTGDIEQRIQISLLARIRTSEMKIQSMAIEMGKLAARGPKVDLSLTEANLFPREMHN